MRDGDYDLAGFCVGAVDRAKALTGNRVAPGDVILGLASSGVHSQRIFARPPADRGQRLEARPPGPVRPGPAARRHPARADANLCEKPAARWSARAGSRRWPTSPAAACSKISRGSCPMAAHADRSMPTAGPCRRCSPSSRPAARSSRPNWRAPSTAASAWSRSSREVDVDEVSEALTPRRRDRPSDRPVKAGLRGCTVQGSAGTWSASEDWSASHHG